MNIKYIKKAKNEFVKYKTSQTKKHTDFIGLQLQIKPREEKKRFSFIIDQFAVIVEMQIMPATNKLHGSQ